MCTRTSCYASGLTFRQLIYWGKPAAVGGIHQRIRMIPLRSPAPWFDGSTASPKWACSCPWIGHRWSREPIVCLFVCLYCCPTSISCKIIWLKVSVAAWSLTTFRVALLNFSTEVAKAMSFGTIFRSIICLQQESIRSSLPFTIVIAHCAVVYEHHNFSSHKLAIDRNSIMHVFGHSIVSSKRVTSFSWWRLDWMDDRENNNRIFRNHGCSIESHFARASDEESLWRRRAVPREKICSAIVAEIIQPGLLVLRCWMHQCRKVIPMHSSAKKIAGDAVAGIVSALKYFFAYAQRWLLILLPTWRCQRLSSQWYMHDINQIRPFASTALHFHARCQLQQYK